MKKMKNYARRVKTILTGTIFASIVFAGNVYGSDIDLVLNTSDAYKTWESLSVEQRQKKAIPRTYDIDIPSDILSNYEAVDLPRIISKLLGNNNSSLGSINAKVSDSRYNIAENLKLRVEDQEDTTQCWAFSLLKSVETNIAIKNNLSELEDFSERHMDYATSKTFLDGENDKGFSREVGKGGLLVTGLAYLTNGQGTVLEDDMPFINGEEKINLAEIDKSVNRIVSEYINFPTIHKEYTKDEYGNTISVKYKKSTGEEYTEEELKSVRNLIKKHLIENGTISSMTGGSLTRFYNDSDFFDATAYNCNDSSKVRDHAITIVGWDDNYSKNNFRSGSKPSTDGAYIVLNSYGDDLFDNGYIYISYEDFFIEEEIYGVCETETVNYDNIYQHDFYGGIYQVGKNELENGYYGVVYNREESTPEILNSVGITLSNYSKIEVYVNPLDGEFSSEKLIKVTTVNEVLEPGYHKISTIPTQLSGEKFAIIIKQTSEDGTFFFQVESNVPDTVYDSVTSDNQSYISLDGSTWLNLADLDVEGIDMGKSDVCVKAFTIKSDEIE